MLVRLEKWNGIWGKDKASESATYILLGKVISKVRIVVGKQYAGLAGAIAPSHLIR